MSPRLSLTSRNRLQSAATYRDGRRESASEQGVEKPSDGADQRRELKILVSAADTADRIAYGILVAALEEGLVRTLRYAVNVLKRFSTPAGMLGKDWLSEQEKKLRERG